MEPKQLHEELIHIGLHEPVGESGLISLDAAQELIKQKTVTIDNEKYILTELGKKAYEFRKKMIVNN